MENIKIFFIAELLYIMGLATSKLSFLFYTWRIFKLSSLRWLIQAVGVLVVLWAMANVSPSCRHHV